MLRSAICGLLLVAGLIACSAQTGLPGEGRCAGLPLFGPDDSLSTANPRVENKDLAVQVSAKGPKLHLRLEPDPKWRASDSQPVRVGWIRVFSCETGALLESLDVESTSPQELFPGWFEVRDVNFDGYLDLAVVREFGAKWARQTWWVFSPTPGKFVSDEFTEALGQVSHNGLVLDAAGQNITASHLTDLTGCGPTQSVYHVDQSGRLVFPPYREPATQP